MIATLDHIDQLTPCIRTYWFHTEKPVGQVAGEFTELHVPHPNMDKRGDRRWFTISSSPTEPLIGITTKIASSSGSSFKRALQALQLGHQVSITEPMGDFVLPKDGAIPLIFVAGGLGITPVRSIIQYLLDKNEKRSIQVFRTVPNAGEAIFADTLKQYPLAYHQYDTSQNQPRTSV
jgi:glycine betaine catabolism B